MASNTFTHLHLHTQHSLLDGAIRIPELMERCSQMGMKSVAMTDHGNMTGAIEFIQRARKYGIKPIVGCEFYLSETTLDDKTPSGRRGTTGTRRSDYHFIVLARNYTGYKNLVSLVSKAHLWGFYYKPRIDRKTLLQHREGLIGASACLGGHLAHRYFQGGRRALTELAIEYGHIFEPGAFFLEVQANGLSEQNELNDALSHVAKDANLPLVATNDCHYLDQEDSYAHDCLMCINTKKLMTDTKRMRHDTDQYYLKSQYEMEEQLGMYPGALESTARIANLVEEYDILPNIVTSTQVPIPGSRLEKLAKGGLRKRGHERDEQYVQRLEYELGVFARMGFTDYMLTMWELVSVAREAGIPMGPGRGSAAGSLVAFCLGITHIDPIQHKLLFERFLNPHRASSPDIDVDVCMDRRGEYLELLRDKYGEDSVAHVATAHELKSRGVIRDVARTMGVSSSVSEQLAKLVPEPDQGRVMPLKEVLEKVPEFTRQYRTDPVAKKIVDIALRLEGLHRHTGKHAGGIIVDPQGDRLWTQVPCSRDPDGLLLVQYDKDSAETAGLTKYDLLGLKTLTVISRIFPEINWAQLKTDDNAVYELLQSGETDGVFQLETRGCQEVLKQLKPDRFEDIVSILALYRPGPLQGGLVESFIKRKHGMEPIVYPHHSCEGILKDTYGVLVYQEQAMAVAMEVAGYSAAEADNLRRAIGKKDLEQMDKHKRMFISKASSRVGPETAEQILSLIESFANYGFNRSHAVAYAYISYMTAWLKAHKPAEYMAALLSCDPQHRTKYVADAKRVGLKLQGPDVNVSGVDFTVARARPSKTGSGCEFIAKGDTVYWGLSAIKHVGDKAAEFIVHQREVGGDYKDIADFCKRVSARVVNRRAIEALIKTGCFDSCYQ